MGVRVYQCMHLAVMIIQYRIFVYWFTRAYAQSSGYDCVHINSGWYLWQCLVYHPLSAMAMLHRLRMFTGIYTFRFGRQ